MRIVSLSLFLLPFTASGYMVHQRTARVKPGLIAAIDAQKTTPVSIKIDVGVGKECSHLAISGLLLELSSDQATDDHIKMPGADGPHSQLSSGVRSLTILKEGSFVNMDGTQSVETQNGCWEIVWKKDATAGSLICGFHVPRDYSRNDAVLPAGRVYLSFPVWSEVGLKEAQIVKEKTLRRGEELKAEREEHWAKFKQENNPIMKAVHYRNAAAILERYTLHDFKKCEIVPNDDEVFALQDDFLLTTKGMAFSKEGSFHRGQHVLLGAAFVGPLADLMPPPTVVTSTVNKAPKLQTTSMM